MALTHWGEHRLQLINTAQSGRKNSHRLPRKKMNIMPSYAGSRINETLIFNKRKSTSTKNNMVIRYGSSVTVSNLINVRGILQLVLIFIFIRWRNWALITSVQPCSFGSTLKGSAGLFSTLPTDGEEGLKTVVHLIHQVHPSLKCVPCLALDNYCVKVPWIMLTHLLVNIKICSKKLFLKFLVRFQAIFRKNRRGFSLVAIRGVINFVN